MGHLDTCLSPDNDEIYKRLKMKTFALVLALAAVAAAKPDFEACPGFEDNSYVNPWSLTLNPDPIVAKEGAEVKVHFDATVLKQLPWVPRLTSRWSRTDSHFPASQSPASPSTLVPATDAEDLLALITPEDCK